jgi:hypothetical protein
MSLKPRRRRRRRGSEEKSSLGSDFWGELNRRIKMGQVIPIISNSVRVDRIFDIDYGYNVSLARDEKAVPRGEELNIDEELAEEWAEEIGYPFPNKHQLARVAIYNNVKSMDDEQAKIRYLDFIKNYLLDVAEDDDSLDPDHIGELRSQLDEITFADIVTELDYPRYEDGRQDPLRLLAKLNLPIYLTTSAHDFMERAIASEGREPRTQICFISGEPLDIDPQCRTDLTFIPTPETPLVYHLHGFEQYPESLILSEDDYLDFLVTVWENSTQTNAPLIPMYLWEALAESSLLMLGYRLHDWDFRVLFRGVINSKHSSLRKFSLAIQLDPMEQRGVTNPQEAQAYLQKYFEPAKFRVEWDQTDNFVQRLWQKWDVWRQGQT